MKTVPVHHINLADVQAVMQHAKENLVGMSPRVHLQGMSRPLTEGERLGLAYFTAALYVAGSHGTDTTGYVAMLMHADSEPSHE